MWDSCFGGEMWVWQQKARPEMLKRWNPTFHRKGLVIQHNKFLNSPLVIFILLLPGGEFCHALSLFPTVFDSPLHDCLLDASCFYSFLIFSCMIPLQVFFNHIWIIEACNTDSSPLKHSITLLFAFCCFTFTMQTRHTADMMMAASCCIMRHVSCF